MFTLRLLSITCIAGILACAGCHPKEGGTVFRTVPSSSTGISFSNEIQPEDTFNIMKYMYFYNGAGVASGDLDQNGLTDLFFTSNQGSCRLYLNQGDLKFRDITEDAGLVTDYWATGAAMVDINDDGWLDIYVCAAGHPDGALRRNRLYINRGDMTFEERAADYGLADTSHSTHAAFLDYDLDGDLDMYLLNHMHQFSGPNDPLPKRLNGEAPNTDKLYVNQGKQGTGYPVFKDNSREAGITIEGFGLGVTVADFNFDNYPDLYISNDFVSNDILYINNGDGTFTNKIDQYIRAQTHNGMGNDVADINNDGYPEIFVSDMLPPDNRRRKLMAMNTGYDLFDISLGVGYEPQYPRNTLQLNNGFDQEGNMYPFSEIGQLAGVHATDWSWSTLFADYDNDGFNDLFISNGHLKDLTDLDFIVYRQQRTRFTSKEAADSLYLSLLEQMPGVSVPNTLFRNTGDLNFENVTRDWYNDEPTFSNGAIYDDLDNDGDLDIVVNCVNREALVMENVLNNEDNGFLNIELTGPPGNPGGRGAKARLYSSGMIQYAEQYNERGYMSSRSGVIHFGIPTGTRLDSLVVSWPNGKSQVILNPVRNTRITVDHSMASARGAKYLASSNHGYLTLDTSFKWKDTDPAYPDHKYVALIPRSYSTLGPGVAVGDINGDDIDDLVIGGGYAQPTTIALQLNNGKFRFHALDSALQFDDTGLLLFDMDLDGDLDLYVASGGSDGRASMVDRLYLNDGFGKMELSQTFDNGSSSCATSSDFDDDGDLDLFVGGRLLNEFYGSKPSGHLYINNGGSLQPAVSAQQTAFDSLGMVTSAIWSDYDNDSDADLIVVGEWMPITIFENSNGNLTRRHSLPGLDSTEGWWNSIAGGDFDNDGDIDYIAGNYGLNSDYTASTTHPIRLHSGYLDNNRSWDILITKPMANLSGEIETVPVHSRNQLLDQFNVLKKEYTSYELYATATEDDLFNSELLSRDHIRECRMLESVFIENLREDGFRVHHLPRLAQIAPVHDIEVADINDDGYLDAVMAMNFFDNDVYRGRADASVGICLLGDGHGGFKALLPSQSGYFLDGNTRAIASYDRGDGKRVVFATRNNDDASAFAIAGSENRERMMPEITERSGTLRLANGDMRKIEFYYGSGYLSQSTRAVLLPTGASFINPDKHEN